MGIERIIFFDGIGEIKFKRNSRARRLTIRVKTPGDINVTVPAFVNFNQAEAFVKEKAGWIRKTQERLNERSQGTELFHDLTEFSTISHVLKIERIDGDKIKRKIGNSEILVSVPFTVEISSQPAQEKIREAIIETWKKEAKTILPERIERLAFEYGFKFTGLSIKHMGTRWGSCSGKNKINLNLHLVRLPLHLCDYVILHELVHTIHKNHGPKFWETLDRICGDAKGKARELRNYRIEIW
jgi:predicted metal-dependent hydrolase